MVTLERAKKIAEKRLADICGCTEFTDAYMFVNPRSEDTIGGFDMPVFIMKSSGKCVSANTYYMQIGTGIIVREIHF